MNTLTGFIGLALSSLVPILVTAMGGMFAQRARATNIALDGCMLIAALTALVVDATSRSPWLGVLAGMAAGAAFAGVLAFAAFVLHCDLVIAGIAANLLATGIVLLVVQNILGSPGTYTPAAARLVPDAPLGPIADIPFVGDALSGQSSLLLVAVAAAIVATVVSSSTRFGLHVQAAGESEEAAAAVGIRPVRIRTVALLISGVGAGIGGAYLSISSVGTFNSNLTGGIGFIAFAAAIFGRATPRGTIGAAVLFAAAAAAAIQLQGTGSVDPQLLQLIPYVATIVALAFQSARDRRRNRFGASDTSFLPAIIPRG